VLTHTSRDFMESDDIQGDTDYFGRVHYSQEHPEFTVRNLNALTAHQKPLPYNLYSFIRGRDIFDRIENYKAFLDDIRLILQPDGVVEFMEIDPRPRVHAQRRASEIDDHISGPITDWGPEIADRFRDPWDG